MEGEKIRSNSRSYGSTQTKVSTDRVVYIVHAVLPNETVAGLSVKYDVPVSLILASIYMHIHIYFQFNRFTTFEGLTG